MADRMILDVNARQPAAFEGVRDIYYGTALAGYRQRIHLLQGFDRIGVPGLQEKIVAVVEPKPPEYNTFKPVDDPIDDLALLLDRATSPS